MNREIWSVWRISGSNRCVFSMGYFSARDEITCIHIYRVGGMHNFGRVQRWLRLRYFRVNHLRGLQATFGRDRSQSQRAVRFESLPTPGTLGSRGPAGLESPIPVSTFTMYYLSPHHIKIDII